MMFLLGFVVGAVVGIPTFMFVINYLEWRDWNG